MDYKKLGLHVGLEIHQQLNSGTKLFCRCPIIRSEEFPIEIRRKLRAVPGELGDTDPAALQEYLKNKTFIYKANSGSSCLVETDEDPPKSVNESAVKTIIQVCKLLDCDIANEIHFMRKTVVDGSAVSGFQRTVLVGSNGRVEGEFGKVGIQTVMLEEDAAPPISKEHSTTEYRLDRLGIPLVEIATTSEINSPDMARHVAEHIGLLLRSTDVVRGIGSIRQDINISIEAGERVEIKGFQELEKIPGVVMNEVNRQLALIEIKNELRKRGFKGMKSGAKDVTKTFGSTRSNFIRKIVDNRGFVYALKLDKFSGLLKRPCGDRTFGKELSAYAEAYGLGIIHADEDVAKYGLDFEFRKLHGELAAEPEDLILITAGYNVEQISNALDLIVKRANHCVIGVPKETRTADGEGSKYTRPLPGSGRLYPESDVPPFSLSKKFISSIEVPKTLMEKHDEMIRDMKKRGVKESIARALITYRNVNSDDAKTIMEYSKMFPKADPNIIARMVIEMPKELKARFRLEPRIDGQIYVSILDALNKGKIPADSILYILVEHLAGKTIEESIEKYSIVSDSELKKIIADVIRDNKGRKESVLMGLVMQKVRGRADGQKVARMLRQMM